MIIPIDLENGRYTVHISEDSFDILGSDIEERKSRIFIVADKLAYEFHGKRFLDSIGIKPSGLFMVHGEEMKNMAVVSDILETAANAGITRGDCMIAFGGGVCGDITGFSAAIFMRGIDFYQVPTTLLSQVDSSVGGKTGVDLGAGKNLAGCFKQPKGVYIDTGVLETLGESEIRQGKAEMIKAAAIKDEGLFRSFEKDMYINEAAIGECIRIKLSYVENDEFDTGKRMILNFGHTIAHALENTMGYGNISHGEAVAIGMALSADMSEKAGISEMGTAERIKNLIQSQGLPVSTGYSIAELSRSILIDKKVNRGMLREVFLEKVGKAILKEMSLEQFMDMGEIV